MRGDVLRPWLCIGLGLALGSACAAGVENPDTTFNPSPMSGPSPATSSGESEGDEDPFPDPDPIDTTTGWPPPDETTGSPDETTSFGDETTFGDPTTDDGGPTGDCPNLATCQGAGSIGMVSGDEGSNTIGTSGSEPTWVEFRVTENDDSLVGASLSFTATLTSPAGANFDLYVYRGVEGGATGCNGFLEQSTSAGAQDEVSMSWGEGVAANGLDDGAWVAVEIRAKDDMCAPPEEWTLTVEGNT